MKDKQEYHFYRKADLASHGLSNWKWYYLFWNDIIRFQRLLRKIEYYEHCKHGFFSRVYLEILRYRFRYLSVHLGFTIPPHVFGPGLNIAHYGSIVINDMVRVGKNCRLHSATNIGEGNGGCPVLGDNVYVGPGAKIFGAIKIGDNVAIGANAVVNKDVSDNVSVAGVPARVVSTKGSQHLIKKGC